jgi:hypothetical protein
MISSEQKSKLDSTAILTWTGQWCQGEPTKVWSIGPSSLAFDAKKTCQRASMSFSFSILQSIPIFSKFRTGSNGGGTRETTDLSLSVLHAQKL